MRDSSRRVGFTDPFAMLPVPGRLPAGQRVWGCVMETRRRLFGCALVIWTALALASMAGTALAATPPSGTVTESNPTVTWTGMVMPPTAGGCGGPNNSACDNFKLNIIPPSAAFGPYSIRITLTPTARDGHLAGCQLPYDVDGDARSHPVHRPHHRADVRFAIDGAGQPHRLHRQ